MSYQEARRQAHRKALKLTGGLVRENPISERDVKASVDAIIDAAVKKMQETDVFLSQSDPMKVLPPEDDTIIGNDYGTCFMNAKTADKLLWAQNGYKQAVLDAVRLLDEFLSDGETKYTHDEVKQLRGRMRELEEGKDYDLCRSSRDT